MAKIVTLGEIMLRLSPPDHQRFLQASSFDINYGGAEANVAAELAQLGHDVSYVTKVPDNELGKNALATLKKLGVDCSGCAIGGDRLGIFFLENGASIRPSRVIYDRKDSAIAKAVPEDFDFDRIFEDVDLFHISGITPVLSDTAAAVTRAAVKAAKAHGAVISFDWNFRKKLWTDRIEEKQKVMAELAADADICFGNALDAQKCLGYSDGVHDFENEPYENCVSEEAMAAVVKQYGLKCLITTLRKNYSASDNGWCGSVCDGETLYQGKTYDLHIVDRVGGGDAFAAGFLHGYLTGKGMESALEWGLAAAAIKHTVPGDLNFVTEEEIRTLVEGDSAGRVVR